MRRGQIEWMTAHLGDVLLALFVVTMGILLSYSLHDESFFGFDDFYDVLRGSNSGDYEREHAHIVILDNPSAIVYFEGKQNLIYSYNSFEGVEYLNQYVGLIEVEVPSACDKNCLCYMKHFEVSTSGYYTTLSEDKAKCYNNVGFPLSFSAVYGEKDVYDMSNGWLIERGLAELATDNDEVYDVDLDENSKGAAISNQIQARRRTVYVSSDQNDPTVYVYQFHKRTDGENLFDETSQSTEYDFVPGELGGTDHDKQMTGFDDRN